MKRGVCGCGSEGRVGDGELGFLLYVMKSVGDSKLRNLGMVLNTPKMVYIAIVSARLFYPARCYTPSICAPRTQK